MMSKSLSIVLFLMFFVHQISVSLCFTAMMHRRLAVQHKKAQIAAKIPNKATSLHQLPLFASFNMEQSPSNDVVLCELQTFLRLVDVVPTGGAAKHVIQAGSVKLNNHVEKRRAKKLCPGDVVTFEECQYNVEQHVARCGYVYKPKKKKRRVKE